MEYQQASPATTFSQKLSNGGGLTGKHAYDGVFGGSVKCGSRMEDYREIFGGSATCSIPILDFPELKERSTSLAERSKKPDYSTIFGGFEEPEFAVSYEELFSKPKRSKNSSQEARVPAEARCRTEGPKNSKFSEEKRTPSPQKSFQTIDDVKQFNVSYNKSHLGSKNGTNGTTHIAQIHAVPGYACLIDEEASQQVTSGGKPVQAALNDTHLNASVREGIKASKLLRKVVSGPQPRGPIRNTSSTSINNSEIRKKSRTKSFSNDISFDTFEIGLGVQASPMFPSNISSDKGSSFMSSNSKFGVSGGDDSKDAAGSHSPPYLEEEIDINSAAAASAAAVRKAIEEAQAKIKLAKELMERKKQGFENRAKSSFNDGLKAERREKKPAEKANQINEEAQEMHLKDSKGKQVTNGSLEHITMQARQAAQNFRNVKKLSTVENDFGERRSTRAKWAQVDSGLIAESRKAMKGLSEPASNFADKETALEVNQEINVEKTELSASVNIGKETMTRVENLKKPLDSEKILEVLDKVPKQEKVQMQLHSVEATFQWDIYRHHNRTAEEQENEVRTQVACEHDEAPQIPEVTYEQEQCKSYVRQLREPEESTKSKIQELEGNKDIEETREVQYQLENNEGQRDTENQEEMGSQSNEFLVREENEKGVDDFHRCEKQLDDLHRCESNGSRQKEDLDREECENKPPGHCHQEENEKKQENCVSKPEDTAKSVQVHNQEVTCVKLNRFEDKEESEKRQIENSETRSNGDLEEAKENDRKLKEDCQMHEAQKDITHEDVESERIQTEIHLGSEDESIMEVTQGTFSYQEKNLEAANYVYKVGEYGKSGKADEAYGEDFEGAEVTSEVAVGEEDFEGAEVTSEVAVLENERMIQDCFPKETGKGSKAVEESDDRLEEQAETFYTEEGPIGLDQSKKQTADLYSGETDLKLDYKQNECHVTDNERVCEQKEYFEEVTYQNDKSDEYSDSEMSFNDEETGSNFVASNSERQLNKGIESEALCDPEKQVEEAVCRLEEINQDIKDPERPTNHEEDETFFDSSSEEKWVNNRIVNVQATKGPRIFEGEEQNMEVSQEEGEEKKVQASQEERTNQSIDKENYQETQTVELTDTEDNLQKEVKLGKGCQEREEEAKIREMEKEKERIAVERAIREARERAFAEARERAAAERAAAEAHQRVMAEARGRSEKVSAEANGKSAAEKASMEAKLKAERAAVERATAEARERALEKALSEKASFKMRHQAEKSATEKFSSASRDSGIKIGDQHSKGSGLSSYSRYPSFSNNDVPLSMEKCSGTNGESAERFKAIFERNQRTAERAAKALAEKNMRDLLAQKEQAERNRLAGILDADVKRWSSGKERNLRALLSTLQYILGSDSGWQPIPLTDLVSTAAVKKAYRKATLFVHPDKLQQRGASIQQKYICEKVFDLLKDAWNKFSAEER